MPVSFALNHMTTPALDYKAVLAMANRLGMVGVEFRNDFSHRELFEGDAPEEVHTAWKTTEMPILALSEVKMFNRWSDQKAHEAERLMQIANAAGIPAISLIPANDGTGLTNGERQANLRLSLRELGPMLESYELIGNVEPLGFPISSLRHKREAVEAIHAIDNTRFKIIHDTFHHALSGDEEIFPEETAIVHISGVVNSRPAIENLQDADRVLVEKNDRLGNIEQMRQFVDAGWQGAFSFEPFAKEIHELDDPEAALRASMTFINQALEDTRVEG